MFRVGGQPCIGNVPVGKFFTEAWRLFGNHRHYLTARRNPPQLMQPVTKMPAEVSN